MMPMRRKILTSQKHPGRDELRMDRIKRNLRNQLSKIHQIQIKILNPLLRRTNPIQKNLPTRYRTSLRTRGSGLWMCSSNVGVKGSSRGIIFEDRFWSKWRRSTVRGRLMRSGLTSRVELKFLRLTWLDLTLRRPTTTECTSSTQWVFYRGCHSSRPSKNRTSHTTQPSSSLGRKPSTGISFSKERTSISSTTTWLSRRGESSLIRLSLPTSHSTQVLTIGRSLWTTLRMLRMFTLVFANVTLISTREQQIPVDSGDGCVQARRSLRVHRGTWACRGSESSVPLEIG